MSSSSLKADQYQSALDAQCHNIEKINNYKNVFHPVFPNNFSIVCINKRLILDELKDNNTRALSRLNVANYNLYRFCELLNSKTTWSDSRVNARMDFMLNSWDKTIKAGNSFLCFDFANAIFQAFLLNNIPIHEELNSKKYRVIIDEFKRLDYKWKSFFKISVYCEMDSCNSILGDLINNLFENVALAYYVERVEIAKEHFQTDLSDQVRHPIINIILDRDIVISRCNPLISRLCKTLTNLCGSYEPNSNSNFEQYQDFFTKEISVSQGFKAYKKYLNLLGSLSEIYDESKNFAYLKI